MVVPTPTTSTVIETWLEMDPSIFETIRPSHYTTFTFPSPTVNNRLLRIAVLDSSTTPPATPPLIGAMLVPPGRESDWIFSTQAGHTHLLLNCSAASLSRLILVGDNPPDNTPSTSYNSTLHSFDKEILQQQITPLLIALNPRSCFGKKGELPEVPFYTYEDGVVKSVVLEICEGPVVGEMLVENVELEQPEGLVVYLRRLRFKRVPHALQTQVMIRPKSGEELVHGELRDEEFVLDCKGTVHTYLSAMVSGIALVSASLQSQVSNGFRPRALCLGVGGGALLGFLTYQLDFEVVGIELDKTVVRVALKYFGLSPSIEVCVDDGIEYVRELGNDYLDLMSSRFDVIMVDLDSSDYTLGVSAPPVEFMERSVLEAAREVLYDHGAVILNVIAPSEEFYEWLIAELQMVFEKLYEIDVGNEHNFVLIATKSEAAMASGSTEAAFLKKLKSVVSASYINSIVEIERPSAPDAPEISEP